MSIIVKFDKPDMSALAVDNTPPLAIRNMDRLSHTMGTVSGTLAFDASYPTGGYGPMNNFGFKSIAGVLLEDVNGYGVYYNKSTDKIQVFSTATTEVANATNLSALPAVYFEAKGLVF